MGATGVGVRFFAREHNKVSELVAIVEKRASALLAWSAGVKEANYSIVTQLDNSHYKVRSKVIEKDSVTSRHRKSGEVGTVSRSHEA